MTCWGLSTMAGKYWRLTGYPRGSVVKNLPANAGHSGDMGSTLGSRRSPEGGNGNPLQYSSLGNPTDRGAWWVTLHRVAKSQTRLGDWSHMRALETNSSVVTREQELESGCLGSSVTCALCDPGQVTSALFASESPRAKRGQWYYLPHGGVIRFLFKESIIYLFLPVLGLHSCA